MNRRFFKKRIEPSCSYCRFGQICKGTTAVVCSKVGISEAAESCRKFKYDPVKRVPRPPQILEKFTEDDFKL